MFFSSPDQINHQNTAITPVLANIIMLCDSWEVNAGALMAFTASSQSAGRYSTISLPIKLRVMNLIWGSECGRGSTTVEVYNHNWLVPPLHRRLLRSEQTPGGNGGRETVVIKKKSVGN